MDALIDEVLETILHSAIWRSTAYLSFTTLIVIAILAFAILAYRRTRKRGTGKTRRKAFRYRSRYRK